MYGLNMLQASNMEVSPLIKWPTSAENIRSPAPWESFGCTVLGIICAIDL